MEICHDGLHRVIALEIKRDPISFPNTLSSFKYFTCDISQLQFEAILYKSIVRAYWCLILIF